MAGDEKLNISAEGDVREIAENMKLESDARKKEKELERKKDVLTELLYTGYYSEEVKVGDKSFKLRTLSMAELNYADVYVQNQLDVENLNQVSSTRLLKVAYLAMSILNPFEAAGSNTVKDAVEYIRSKEFDKLYKSTVEQLSVKPQVILDYLYQKYSDLVMKSMRVLEPPAGMDNGDYLKNS